MLSGENTQSHPSVLITISIINYIWIYIPNVTPKEGSNGINRNNNFFLPRAIQKMLVKRGTRLLNTLWVFDYFKVKVKVSNLVLDIFSSSYNEDLTTLFGSGKCHNAIRWLLSWNSLRNSQSLGFGRTNNGKNILLGSYYEPGALWFLHKLSHLILTTTLTCRFFFIPVLQVRKQRGNNLLCVTTASNWQN